MQRPLLEVLSGRRAPRSEHADSYNNMAPREPNSENRHFYGNFSLVNYSYSNLFHAINPCTWNGLTIPI